MKTRNTLIALAVAAAALTGVAATTTQAATATVAVAFHDHDGRRDNGRWDDRGGRQDDRSYAITSRIQTLQGRIYDGRRNGTLSRREAGRLEGRLSEVASLKRSYERSGRGLSGQEAQTLHAKLDYVSSQVRYERHDHNRW